MFVLPPNRANVANFPEILGVMDAGDGARSRSQLIERKIEALEDMATKVRKLIQMGAAFLPLATLFCLSLVDDSVQSTGISCQSCDQK